MKNLMLLIVTIVMMAGLATAQQSCTAGYQCASGVCVNEVCAPQNWPPACAPIGTVDCDEDVNNCGAIDWTCGPRQNCVNGGCQGCLVPGTGCQMDMQRPPSQNISFRSKHSDVYLSLVMFQQKKTPPPPPPQNCSYFPGIGWLCGSGGTSGTGVTDAHSPSIRIVHRLAMPVADKAPNQLPWPLNLFISPIPDPGPDPTPSTCGQSSDCPRCYSCENVGTVNYPRYACVHIPGCSQITFVL